MKPVKICLIYLIILSCDNGISPVPDCDPDPCAENACQPENCDTIIVNPGNKFLGLDTLWLSILPNNAQIRQMVNADENLIISAANANSYELICIRKSDGELLWTFSDPIVDYFADIHYHEASNTLIAQRWSRVVSIDGLSGQMISNFKADQYAASATYGSLLGDYYYMPVRSLDEEFGYILKSHISNLTLWEEVYTIHTDQVGGSRPSVNSINYWLHPITKDEILVFQHRMAFPKRIDLVAYNMTADSLFWWHPNIAPEGNSSINQIDIFQDKAIFFSVRNAHCVDMLTGTILWQSNFEENAQRTFLFASAAFLSDNKIMISSERSNNQPPFGEDYLNIVDLSIGNILSELKGRNFVKTFSDDPLLFMDGRERCYNVETNKFVWNDNIDFLPHGVLTYVYDSSLKTYYGAYFYSNKPYLTAWSIPIEWYE